MNNTEVIWNMLKEWQNNGENWSHMYLIEAAARALNVALAFNDDRIQVEDDVFYIENV